jgi:hypothetical protein
MKCPQCGAETPDDEWNCVSCRVNLYWAVQHYEGLAEVRERQGLPGSPSSPTFLIKAHKDAMDDRAERGGRVVHKVRAVARMVMRRKSLEGSAGQERDPDRTADGSGQPGRTSPRSNKPSR